MKKKKKTFDAVAWMRTRRVKIDDEDQGLSWTEKYVKTRQLLKNDPLWIRLKDRVFEPSSLSSIGVQESRGKYGLKKGK